MKRDKESAEVTARINMADGIAYLNVAAWPKYAEKFERKYGKPKFCWRNQDGDVVSAFWEVPMRCVSFRNPQKRTGRGNPNLGKMKRRKRRADSN